MKELFETPSASVLVIGGGPAGLMAAIGAARSGAKVTLLEKGKRLGRKLLISGGGRCNVTNARGIDHIVENTPGNGRFLFSALHQWSNEDIIRFFQELGVKLKEEDRGRMFPVTNRASTVLDALLRELDLYEVRVEFGAVVKKVIYQEKTDNFTVHIQSGGTFEGSSVVVAVGGCSVPETGSTGDGYIFAQAFGHTIIEPYPTSVALVSHDEVIQSKVLQGLSLRQAVLRLYDPRGRLTATEDGDILFTHFGLSGPAALRISQYAVKNWEKFGAQPLLLTIDTDPQKSIEDWIEQIFAIGKTMPKRAIRTILRDVTATSLANYLVDALQLPGDLAAADMNKHDVAEFVNYLKVFPLHIADTLGLSRATVTGGGISVKEIDPRTMQSRRQPGLFFAGEVMDVHAHTGGYNITVAFSTGYVAGQHAAMRNEFGS